VGSNSEIQEYNLYPMLHFHRKFTGGVAPCFSRTIEMRPS